MPSARSLLLPLALLASPLAPACSSDEPPPAEAARAQRGARFPEVLDATARREPGGTWTFAVTLSSPYDSPERYADAWRVLSPDGAELGLRHLTHDHANEQPFTREQGGIVIPEGIETVTIEGRDSVNGWGGTTLELPLER